jgi:twinkle protein
MELETFLTERAIDPELAIGKLNLHLTERGGKPAIVIPFVQNGEVVNNKYRTFDKQFSQDKDATKCFYNYDVINDPTLKKEPLIITEGEIDALTFIQAGFVKTVSVPDGAPNEKHDEWTEKYSYLDNEIANIRKNSPYVILATDRDGNGDNLLHDLALRIGRDFCKWVKYPQLCKDVNEAWVKYGTKHPNVIQQIIDTQEWLEVDGVFTMRDLPPVAQATVYDIDMPGFDKHMKIRLGDFSVVTGIPGMGKSTFVNDVMARVADKHALKIAFASFEQHPTLDHLRNLTRWHEGTHGPSNAEEWINRNFCFIYPSDRQQLEEMIDLDWFLERASVAVVQHGAKIVVIDPWNELEHKTGRRESLTEYVGKSIKRLKSFARSNNVHVMVVAHPAKMYRNKDGNFPVPSLYDISDSAHWANKADLGIVVHRDSYESSETQISNRKSRYHDIIGVPGTEKFYFNKETNRFMWSDID